MTNRNISDLPVHPLADAFPMLSKWELQELADDIKANGQNHPIVIGEIDGKQMLIDGRNRRAACLLAKVEPLTRELDGVDAVALIVSENLMRRNLTISQRAMLEVTAYPITKGNQYKKSAASASNQSTAGTSTMANARAIIKHAPDLVGVIISGSMTVKEGYRKLQEREAANNRETTLYDELKEDAPDLAERVDNGESLATVWTSYQDRLNGEKSCRKNALSMTANSLSWFSGLTTKDSRKTLIDYLGYTDEVEAITGKPNVISELRAASKVLNKLIEEIDNG